MSGEFEAVGGMATTGLVAAAVEGPNPGEAGEGPCLNCGAALNGGRFCSACGQPARPNRSLWHLLEELLWNVFNLDTKAWRTLPRLVLRPGTLTRTYIDGQRARYLTPLATFLLCYFFMFLVFSTLPHKETFNLSDHAGAERVTDARDELNEAQADLKDAQEGLSEARSGAGAHPGTAARLGIAAAERGVTLAQAGVARRQAALDRAQRRQQEAARAPVRVGVSNEDAAEIRQSRAANTTTPTPVPPAAPAGDAAHAPPAAPATPSTNLTDNGDITLDDILKKVAHDNITVDGKAWLSPQMQANLANPPLFYNHLQEAASRWGFLLVPLSLPFIGFLFLFKKKVTLFDHAVFALNSLSFASLVFALIPVGQNVHWLDWLPGTAIGIGLPVHTFFHVGGAYKLKWWSAFWRTWFLLFFATFVLIFFLIAVFFIGLAG